MRICGWAAVLGLWGCAAPGSSFAQSASPPFPGVLECASTDFVGLDPAHVLRQLPVEDDFQMRVSETTIDRLVPSGDWLPIYDIQAVSDVYDNSISLVATQTNDDAWQWLRLTQRGDSEMRFAIGAIALYPIDPIVVSLITGTCRALSEPATPAQ
jgi:hypothetical protein